MGFTASSIVKKKESLLQHVLKKKMGFRVFTSPFNRTLVAQKLFRTDTFCHRAAFEMDRSLKTTNDKALFFLLETALNSAHKDCDVPLPLSYLHLPLHYEM